VHLAIHRGVRDVFGKYLPSGPTMSAPTPYLNGIPELPIMRKSRHQSLDTVRKYIRDRSLFRDKSGGEAGIAA